MNINPIITSQYLKAGLETTYKLSKTVLSLPMHPYLHEKDIIYITQSISEACIKIN